MFKFGDNSEAILATVDDDLVRVVRRAMQKQVMDFSVTSGSRTEAEQRRNVERGVSKTMNSKHVVKEEGEKARAVDILPYPLWVNGVSAWKDRERLCVLAGVIKAAASDEGVPIRWGGDWDGDGNNADSNFDDFYHFELLT